MVEEIEKRIGSLIQEQSLVAAAHERMLSNLRQNQTRYAQITGAIAELQELKKSLNGAKPE